MSIGTTAPSSISIRTLALHAAAAVFALGAAALASHALQTRTVDTASNAAMTLTASAPVTATPDRIAGLIEPAIRASAEAARPLLEAVAKPPIPTARPVTLAATASTDRLPPLPQPRPCLDCQAPEVAAAAPVADEAPVPVVIAAADAGGPVPPMPVGAGADADVSPAGLVMRGGQAVVDGSLQAVGTAWNVSGAAVDGLVRSVRNVSF